MTILMGIDPGLLNCGIAIIKSEFNHDLLFSECIKTDPKQSTGSRLAHIEERLHTLAESYEVDEIGVESIFFNRNITSCLDTAKVIGVAELVANSKRLAL